MQRSQAVLSALHIKIKRALIAKFIFNDSEFVRMCLMKYELHKADHKPHQRKKKLTFLF